jgi:hypothetical protein
MGRWEVLGIFVIIIQQNVILGLRVGVVIER